MHLALQGGWCFFVLRGQKVYRFLSFDSTEVVLRSLFQRNHSVAEAGDHLIHLLCLKQSQPRQVAQGHVQFGSGLLQGWGLHNLLALPAAVLVCLCSLPPALSLGTTWRLDFLALSVCAQRVSPWPSLVSCFHLLCASFSQVSRTESPMSVYADLLAVLGFLCDGMGQFVSLEEPPALLGPTALQVGLPVSKQTRNGVAFCTKFLKLPLQIWSPQHCGETRMNGRACLNSSCGNLMFREHCSFSLFVFLFKTQIFNLLIQMGKTQIPFVWMDRKGNLIFLMVLLVQRGSSQGLPARNFGFWGVGVEPGAVTVLWERKICHFSGSEWKGMLRMGS